MTWLPPLPEAEDRLPQGFVPKVARRAIAEREEVERSGRDRRGLDAAVHGRLAGQDGEPMLVAGAAVVAPAPVAAFDGALGAKDYGRVMAGLGLLGMTAEDAERIAVKYLAITAVP